ncbi:MAG: presenilin family intramembrane aspartyl protease [Candidatus Thermoplasmatota archaeon]|jgi:presenilin-like A22 family membrane protease|nr:presenilin family intramembrane aspartyl protease [Candidatus Thermoplasmatota archaeon]
MERRKRVRKIRRIVPEISAMIIFVASSLFAIYVSEQLIIQDAGIKATSTTGGIGNVLIFIPLIIVFSFAVIFLARKRKVRFLKWIFILMVTYVVFYVSLIISVPIAAYIADTLFEFNVISLAIVIVLPLLFLYLLAFRNEWYVVDASGIMLVAGVSSVWGVIVGIWAAVALLIIFAVYDYISVYKTKHMIALAEAAVDENLPLLFVIPSRRGTKLNDITFAGRGEHGAMMLGFGDIAMPSILVVSAFTYSYPVNWFYFVLFTMIGVLAAMFLLFFTNVEKPAPGLPYINTGAILGFLAAFILFSH